MDETPTPVLPEWAAPHLPDFQRIARVIDLAPGFMLVPVELSGPDVARALGAWLTSTGRPTVVVEPRGDDAWSNLAATLFEAEPKSDGAVLVVGPREESSGLRRGLHILNQRRDSLAKHLARPLVWSGPKEFLDITWRSAPDFWSIADVPRRLSAAVVVDAPLELDPVVKRASAPETSPEGLAELYEAAKAQGDLRNAARLALRLAEVLFFQDAYARAEEVATEALAALEGLDDPALAARAYDVLGRSLFRRGILTDAARALEDAVAAYESAGDEESAANTLGVLGGLFERTGDLSQARSAYLSALSISESHGSSRGNVAAITAMGRLATESGHLEEAEAFLRQAIDLHREQGDRLGEAYAWSNLGVVLFRAGRFDDGVEALSRDLRIREDVGDERGVAAARYNLGVMIMIMGRLDDASAYARSALATGEAVGDAHLVEIAGKLLADIASRREHASKSG